MIKNESITVTSNVQPDKPDPPTSLQKSEVVPAKENKQPTVEEKEVKEIPMEKGKDNPEFSR